LRPVFIARNVTDTGFSKIVKEQHLRFSVKQDNVTITGIGFGMSGKYALLATKQPIDIVFKIDINEWNGEKKLQIRVIDLKLSN